MIEEKVLHKPVNIRHASRKTIPSSSAHPNQELTSEDMSKASTFPSNANEELTFSDMSKEAPDVIRSPTTTLPELPDLEERPKDGETEALKLPDTEESPGSSKSPESPVSPEKKEEEPDLPWSKRMKDVFKMYWYLGMIAFGGTQANIAILRDHLVVQRPWVSDQQFTELFAISQGLPGPTATQIVVSTATLHAGIAGGLLAFCLYGLPAFIVMTITGVLIAGFVDSTASPWYLAGLAPSAAALVFTAMYGFADKLDKLGKVIALWSCLITILISGDYHIPTSSSQYIFPSMLLIGGLFTLWDSKRAKPFAKYKKPSETKVDMERTFKRVGITLWGGVFFFMAFAAILTTVICLVQYTDIDSKYLLLFETMYRNGSIIFGGGQVVLPLLFEDVVSNTGMVTKEQFFAGLGIVGAIPGPLFNFAAYIGAVYLGVPGAFVAYIALFGPGVILIFGMMPFWAKLRQVAWFQAVLAGVNATAIGFVGAACVILWEGAVENSADAIVFTIAGFLSIIFIVPAPLVILICWAVGAIMHEDVANLGQVPFCVQHGYVPKEA